MELATGASNVSGESVPVANASNNTQIGAHSTSSTAPLDQCLQQASPLYPPQPIYCSDGVIYPGEFGNPRSSESTDQEVALPNNLVEVYNHLGIIGKLLTSGSLATIRIMQICRNLSESLADALGITRPVYEYEINQYNEMKIQEEQRQRETEVAYASWKPPMPTAQPIMAPNCGDLSVNDPSTPTAATVNMEAREVQLPDPLIAIQNMQ